MARYDARKDKDGWSVFDTTTGEPVRVNDVLQVEMDAEDADDLADLLNLIESRKPARTN